MTQTIEREAKLFESGSYPDRGLEITEDDLDQIIANTSEAPVRVEHTDTPFDGALGVLKSLYRKGSELFGRICFTKAAWELIKQADARKLSVAIKKDKSAIAEISIVRRPRVADAAVFSTSDAVILGEIDLPEGLEFSESFRLKSEILEKEADRQIDELKRAGKLVPAAEVFARAILKSDESSVITFGDTPTPLSQVFRWFMDSQPKVIEFSELAPASASSFDEPEIFLKLGVTSSQVEKHKGR